jgi:hypothetical protein
MFKMKRPRGAANTEGPKPKHKRSSPSLLDLETLWQGVAWRFESRGARVPMRWRLIRRAVATLFLAGERGAF